MSIQTEPTAPAYTSDAQARFPERELAKLATEYETTAAVWANNSRAALAKKATARAETLRQAIDSHDALRERWQAEVMALRLEIRSLKGGDR
jgi:hypothetical protein